MAALGLRQGLEPVGDLAEALVARRFRHARVHVGVLVRLARHRGFQVFPSPADRQVGGRIADCLEVLEVAVRVAGLAFGGGTEQRGNVVVALHVGLRGEVEVAAVCLRFAGERGFQDSVPEARLLSITPYDKTSIKAIEKAILESDVGLTPNNDGNVIRLTLPELTEERRKDLVKVVHGIAEEGRVSIRHVRRDVMHDLKELKSEGEVGEDEEQGADEVPHAERVPRVSICSKLPTPVVNRKPSAARESAGR